MKTRIFSIACSVLLISLLATSGAQAQSEISQTCAYIAQMPTWHGTQIFIPYGTLFAGETVSATVGEPNVMGTPQTVYAILVNDIVDTSPFPGTVSYTIPADGFYILYFAINGNATWDLDCTPAIPLCNGLTASIYVKDEMIVGGPDDGAAYTGTLLGTSNSDVIVGTDGVDAIEVGPGNDTVCGLGGDDTIAAGPGDYTMLGGQGADHLNGASGTDSTPDFNAGEGDKQTNVP